MSSSPIPSPQSRFKIVRALGLLIAGAFWWAHIMGPTEAAELVRYVSHEDPRLNIANARLAVGRDGRVYLWSDKYVLRMNRDGSGKGGHEASNALTAAMASSDGVIATANAHFVHAVNLWSPGWDRLGTVGDFLNDDRVGFTSPGDVQAGTGADFYALDQNRNRIVRLAPPGQLVTTYPLAALDKGLAGRMARLRVWEPGQRFYLLGFDASLHVVGFDGKPAWTTKLAGVEVGIDPWSVGRGGFDVDAAGRLFALADGSDVIQVWDSSGRPQPGLQLRMGPRRGRVSDFQVFGDDILVRRPDPIELFEVYDRATGVLRRVVRADVEVLRLRLGSEVWTAGSQVLVAITLEGEGRSVAPDFRPTIRPLGGVEFRELRIREGALDVPADAGGLYQFRATPGRSGAMDEYGIETVVEVRRSGARGSLAVATPLNRSYYGQGEPIPFALIPRIREKDIFPASATVQLLDGERVIEEDVVRLKPDGATRLGLAGSLTAALRPGSYLLTASAPGLTPAPQTLEIGPGIRRAPAFHVVQHGDYGGSIPEGKPFDLPEHVAAHLARSRKLGVNLFVDRLGSTAGLLAEVGRTIAPEGLADRVRTDPRSPALEKVTFEGPLGRTMAAYGAFGIQEQGVLLNMDAGLPVGTAHDPRPLAELEQTVTRVTTALAGYPALRGWSWAANWWVGKLGAAAAATPVEEAAYRTALDRARREGTWDPVLDRVTDTVLGHATAAEQRFRVALHQAGPGKLDAMTGPYRAVGVIPPVTFGEADEVDLHYQSEQIQPPQVTPHQVDFYRRPGKRAWGHPELWNDDGTGGMIGPTVFQMVMRGVDGVGWSGKIPMVPIARDDPRSGGPGTVSTHRAVAGLLRLYGPWLVTTHNADRVAIVVSSRMLRIDEWSKIGGWYFDRLFEAYNACLYAHRPASFVFAEDATLRALDGYKAVLVVGQRVALDPPLAEALAGAATAGVGVYRDSTCRPELVPDAIPLGVSFDRLLEEPSAWQDDSAYARFPDSFRSQAEALRRTLGGVVPPVAVCDEPAVMLSERRSGVARFVWAVNNVPTGLDPGLTWRVGMLISQRVPVVARLSLGAGQGAVYDVFALRRATGDSVEADLRTIPARLYAILPKPIGGIRLRGPASVPAGRAFAWEAAVSDEDGQAIPATLPVRVRLLGSDGSTLAEDVTAADGQGVQGTFVLPLNAPPGPVVIEAVELVAGSVARLEVPTRGREDHGPTPGAKPGKAPPLAADQGAGASRTGGIPAVETGFGPRFRSVVVAADGGTALLGAFNWDQNLYALDAQTGVLRWRSRVGHHFAYAPAAAGAGFTVQGFDLNTAEGYHLYRLAATGKPERRFALDGLPKRATNWSSPHLLDPINHFASAPDGSWVASSGDLGLSVWDRTGQPLWNIDWRATRRQRLPVLAVDSATLAVLDGTTVTTYQARSGERLWAATPTLSGSLLGGAVSRDRRTLALQSDGEGGRVYVLRGGKVVGTLATPSDAVALTPDGSSVFVTTGDRLRCHAADGSLRWEFAGDDVLRNLAVSADGRRICVGSEIGTFYVLNERGAVLTRPDLGALPAAAWLPDGGLVVATWGGSVIGYDGNLRERWRTYPRPDVADARLHLRDDDPTPTTRRPIGGDPPPVGVVTLPNLLSESNTLITAPSDSTAYEDPRLWQNPIKLFTDGRPDAPPRPWLSWTDVNSIDSGWRGKLTLQVDAFRTRLRVSGLTITEDPAHPESWLRDTRLQWWDTADDRWHDGPYLLSDSATHTHRFAEPIEAARFRFVTTGGGIWPAGNLRLGELAFHGERLGCSHPDVVARRPLAVLYDDREADLACLTTLDQSVAFRPAGAFSGGKCLSLNQTGTALPPWRLPFGHAVPNWDFEVVERPELGQYRYLQFAWKADSDRTTGLSLLLGRPWPAGGVAVVAGTYDWKEGVLAREQTADRPPTEWQVVRVDLFALLKQPIRVQSIALGAAGGGASWDQIILARSLADLDRLSRTR